MNKRDVILNGLQTLGLAQPEATVYLHLLGTPSTHAHISAVTGINRTTVYRIIRALTQRGLVVQRFDDRGKYLMAADPSAFESEVIKSEAEVRMRRATLRQLVPALNNLQKDHETDFAVYTYEGVEGFKRMLWHELKTVDECLCFGYDELENIVPERRWTEKHRQMSVDAGYKIREISATNTFVHDFTDVVDFFDLYELRGVTSTMLPNNHLTVVYNNTVAIYHLRKGRHAGIEIVSKPYAEFMRDMFERVWKVADLSIYDASNSPFLPT